MVEFAFHSLEIWLREICGSDGNTYVNIFLLRKTARDFEEKIKIVHLGPCGEYKASTRFIEVIEISLIIEYKIQ